MRRLLTILLGTALVLLVAACGSSSSSKDVPSDSVAVVGDQNITKAQWDALMTQTRRNFQATKRALAHAGLTHKDVDGFGSNGLGVLPPIEVAEYLGLRPTYVDSTGVGGGTWEVMVEHALAAIQAGHAKTIALVYGSTARADLKKKLRTANLAFGSRGPSQFESPWGHSLMAKYAMTARRHMIEYGTKNIQ